MPFTEIQEPGVAMNLERGWDVLSMFFFRFQMPFLHQGDNVL